MRAGVLIGLACAATAWMLWMRGGTAHPIEAIAPEAQSHVTVDAEHGWPLADPGPTSERNITSRTAPPNIGVSTLQAIIDREKPFWDIRSPAGHEGERMDRIRAAVNQLGPGATEELFVRSNEIDSTITEQLVVAYLLFEIRAARGEVIGDLGEPALKRMRAYLAADGLSVAGARMIALPLAAWGTDADHQGLLDLAESADVGMLRWIALRSLGFAPSRKVAMALAGRSERQALISLQQQIKSCVWAFTPLDRVEVATRLENSLFTGGQTYTIDVLQTLQQWSPGSFERTARRCLASADTDERLIEEALRLQAEIDPQSWLVQNELSQGTERNRLAAAIAVASSQRHPLGAIAESTLLDLAARAERPMSRRRAVIALSRTDRPEVDTVLAAILADDADVDVRRAALGAIAFSSTPAARAAIEVAAENEADSNLRWLAQTHLKQRLRTAQERDR